MATPTRWHQQQPKRHVSVDRQWTYVCKHKRDRECTRIHAEGSPNRAREDWRLGTSLLRWLGWRMCFIRGGTEGNQLKIKVCITIIYTLILKRLVSKPSLLHSLPTPKRAPADIPIHLEWAYMVRSIHSTPLPPLATTIPTSARTTSSNPNDNVSGPVYICKCKWEHELICVHLVSLTFNSCKFWLTQLAT